VGEEVSTEGGAQANSPQRRGLGEQVGSISVDWWATLVAGLITALAVADVLPKIPW
jgi:hypothetical protein